MREIWDQVRDLEGSTLFTLHRNKPFDVDEVRDDEILVIPHDGKRKRRKILRRNIEIAVGLNIPKENLRKRVQQEFPDNQNSSYIAAIVSEVARKPSQSD